MSICDCPTCQEVNGPAVEKSHDNCRFSQRFKSGNAFQHAYPCCDCTDYNKWDAAKPAVVERLEDPGKSCETCARKETCRFQSEFKPDDCRAMDFCMWIPRTPTTAIAHWDGYTGPLIEHIADAVQTITQLGGEEDETDKAINALITALRFVALSHWEHGAKHERESR